MARIRTVKPQFFLNENLSDLSMSTRLLFIGLWTQADRDGKLEDRPKRLKAEIFPYDSVDMEQMLSSLQNAGFIYRYEVGELKLIIVLKFNKHQSVNIKEADSVLPFPEHFKESESILNNILSRVERKGKERKGTGMEGITHEQKIIEILNSSIWIESVAMNFKLNFDITVTWLDDFLRELKLKDDLHKSISEIKKYFINWLKIKIEKEKNSAKKENGNYASNDRVQRRNDVANTLEKINGILGLGELPNPSPNSTEDINAIVVESSTEAREGNGTGNPLQINS